MDNKILNQFVRNIPAPKLCFHGERWTYAESSKNCGIAMYMKEFEQESLALAGLNSVYNFGDKYLESFDKYYTDGMDFEKKTVGVVGYMPQVQVKHPEAEKYYYFDMNPAVPALPAEKEAEILPLCDIVIITASSIINDTLLDVLKMCQKAESLLVGPSAPMIPELLDFGLSRIGGAVIIDQEGIKEYILNSDLSSPYRYCVPFLVK